MKRCPHQPVAAALILAATFGFSSGLTGAGSEAANSQFFEKSIRPLFTQYCLKCHSTEKHKGDMDLERFVSWSEVLRQPKVWQAVSEQLANNEMPPKDKPQPTAAERQRLSGWVNSVLEELAQARAGDPGPVVLRRLSNAEYRYTIGDLTGVESLDPG